MSSEVDLKKMLTYASNQRGNMNVDASLVVEILTRLEQAEQDRVKLRNRLDAMRRQRDGYRKQLRKAEQQIQRVREVCESDGYEVSNEFGTWDAVAVENVLEALDGDGRG